MPENRLRMNVRIQKNGCPVVSDFNTPSRIIVKWLSQCDALIKLTPFRFVVKVLPRFSAECYSLICQTVSVARNRYDYELGMVRIEIPASKNSFFHVAYPLHPALFTAS